MRHSAAALLLALSALAPAGAQDKPLREVYPEHDFRLREAMVPMRDGVKLYTLILTPKQARGPLPILLERTPYDATRALGGRPTTRLEVSQETGNVDGGFIFVEQVPEPDLSHVFAFGACQVAHGREFDARLAPPPH